MTRILDELLSLPIRFRELSERDREFYMNLLAAFDERGNWLIKDETLILHILWQFPEVRYSSRRTEFRVASRSLGSVPKKFKPKMRRWVLIDEIRLRIGRERMSELGYRAGQMD